MSEISTFSQAMPNGDDEQDIPKLLRRVADSIEEMAGIDVHDVVLHDTRVDDEKPSLAVYYKSGKKSESTSFKPKVLTVMLEKGKNQSNVVMLFDRVRQEVAKLGPIDLYDIVLDDEINELGSHYRVQIYFDPTS